MKKIAYIKPESKYIDMREKYDLMDIAVEVSTNGDDEDELDEPGANEAVWDEEAVSYSVWDD